MSLHKARQETSQHGLSVLVLNKVSFPCWCTTGSSFPAGVCLFVCVEVLRPSQPNGVISSAVSLPNHTFTGQA